MVACHGFGREMMSYNYCQTVIEIEQNSGEKEGEREQQHQQAATATGIITWIGLGAEGAHEQCEGVQAK